MQKLSEALSPDTSNTFQKTETSKTFQKTEPYFRRCTQMHQNFATRAACQIVGGWLPASSIDQRPSRPTKDTMTSQQIKTNSYHILSCSDNNYQIQILTVHSPEVMQNQIYSEAMQKLARDSSIVVPQFSEQSCKIARPDLTEAMDHSQVLQQNRSCNQPTWIRNQWKLIRNHFKNESANMNQKPIGIYAEPFKHESPNMNQKLCTNNQNLSPQTCRQLKKTKAPVPDQQSSTSRSPDAHIMASLLLFIEALASALRGGGFRNSRGQFTCREAIKKTVSKQKKTEHCSQWIGPGLENQQIRIFAISFSELQNIDKLVLALREAWNKGIRDYKNKPKQMANKKKRLEKKTCNQLIKSQLLTQRAQSSKPSGRVQSAGDTVISEAQKQGILRSMKLQTRTVNRINNYIYIYML